MLKIDAKLVKLREKLEAEPDAHKRAAISNQIETLRTANAILDGRSSDDDEARKSKARKVKAKSKGKRADEEEDSADEDDAEDEDEEDEKVKGKRTRALLRMTQAALLAATSAHRPPAPHPDEANQRFMDPEKQREAELCREFKGVPGVTRGMIALHRHVNEYAASMKAGA